MGAILKIERELVIPCTSGDGTVLVARQYRGQPGAVLEAVPLGRRGSAVALDADGIDTLMAWFMGAEE